MKLSMLLISELFFSNRYYKFYSINLPKPLLFLTIEYPLIPMMSNGTIKIAAIILIIVIILASVLSFTVLKDSELGVGSRRRTSGRRLHDFR